MSQHPGKLLLFVSLSAADLWLTEGLLAHGDGWFYESNPIANAWLHAYGWTGLVIFKATSVAVVMGACLLISRSSPRASGRVLVFACSTLAVVVVYSWSLSWLVPDGSAATDSALLPHFGPGIERQQCKRRRASTSPAPRPGTHSGRPS